MGVSYMAAPKSKSAIQKEAHLAEVARLYLQFKSQLQIAQRLGVSTRQIRYDLAALKKRWRELQVNNIGERIACELAETDLVEREAWEAWDKSKRDAEVRTQRIRKAEAGGPGSPVEVSIRNEGQTGDATYLRAVLECIQRRCRLLGLYAPTRHIYDFGDLSDEELQAEHDRLEKKLLELKEGNEKKGVR